MTSNHYILITANIKQVSNLDVRRLGINVAAGSFSSVQSVIYVKKTHMKDL